jgi:hypothetical protein
MNPNKLENYLALLNIRQAARRRDAIIFGVVFLLSFGGLIAGGLLDSLSGRSLYLAAALVVGFGFSLVTAWTRLEVIRGSIELVSELLRASQGDDDAGFT